MDKFIGQKFGKLTILEVAEPHYQPNGKKVIYYNCECECGIKARIQAQSVRSGKTKSCGCICKRHGMFGTKEYKAWDSIKQRCYNTNNHAYHDYGARGIKMSKEWFGDFVSFYNDMGKAPIQDRSCSVERRDVNGPYSKENCYWTDDITQHNNRRDNIFLEYNGQIMTIAQWARYFDIPYSTLWHKHKRGDLNMNECDYNKIKRSL